MKIEVIRPETCGVSCTIGEMYVDSEFRCFTLEDVVRPAGEKVYGETAIPPGSYRVDITHSPHFGRDLPLLIGVHNFDGVRIHPGNTAADTKGCILVGLGKTENTITQSRLAFDSLFAEIRDAIQQGEAVWIEVK
jgi:hypothetical protein